MGRVGKIYRISLDLQELRFGTNYYIKMTGCAKEDSCKSKGGKICMCFSIR